MASDTITGTASFTDNYLTERLELYGQWNPIPFTGNTIYGNIDGDAIGQINDISGNTFATSRPTAGIKVFVDANEIDPRRGRVVIYNYDDADSVSVDLSSILKNGEAYRIHSVFGLFENALLTGVYNGASVSIPMGTVPPPQPNGNSTGIDADDGPKKSSVSLSSSTADVSI